MSSTTTASQNPFAEPMELDVLKADGPASETVAIPQDHHDSATQQYPRGTRLILITGGLMLAVFLAALDSTIISTAIPSITTEFGSISNIAW